MLLAGLILGWIVVGAVATVVLRRRGHDSFEWALLFLVLGPLAIPLAIRAMGDTTPHVDAATRAGTCDVLLADDGSDDARTAIDAALALLAGSITSATVASVVDFEAAMTARGTAEQAAVEARLDRTADRCRRRITAPVERVVLRGDPATALRRFAKDHGFELIVAGSGARHGVLGSVARELVTHNDVAVLVGPDAAAPDPTCG